MAHPGSVLCGCTAAPWARGGAVLCSPCCHPGKAARVLGLKAGVSRAGFGEPWGALEGAASGRWCWWWMRGGSWALASPMAGLTITLEALPDTAPTRAAQLVPQQEPGWGRVRPLWLRSRLLGTKCSRRGARLRTGPGGKRPGPGQDPRQHPELHLRGQAPDPALGGLGSRGGCVWGTCIPPRGWRTVLPRIARTSIAPRAAAAALPSPPWRRQQLFRTLF